MPEIQSVASWEEGDVPMPDLEEGEHRIVAADPITGSRGDVEIVALYREYDGGEGEISTHRFSFMYHYLGDDGECEAGLNEWEPEGGTISAVDMTVLQYVKAYFEDYGIPVGVSIRFGERHTADFEQDAELLVKPEAAGGDTPKQWVEGS